MIKKDFKVENELFRNEYLLTLKVGRGREVRVLNNLDLGMCIQDKDKNTNIIILVRTDLKGERRDDTSIASTLLHELVHVTDKIMELERFEDRFILQSRLISTLYLKLLNTALGKEFDIFLKKNTNTILKTFKGHAIRLKIVEEISLTEDNYREKSNYWTIKKTKSKKEIDTIFLLNGKILLKSVVECLSFMALTRLYMAGVDDSETRAYVISSMFKESVKIV